MDRKKIKTLLREQLIKEVRYVNTKPSEPSEPLTDKETIRVYHTFANYDQAKEVILNGLSGKQRAPRIHSYEHGNNPYGLFVTIDFDVAKRFAGPNSLIIEFSTKISDLEAPVWVGGRSYFVQGEYTQSFKSLDDREQQRLINRQEAGGSPYEHISASDRPEVARTIFENPEKQALFIGDLDPNMIKYIWQKENGEWTRFKRKQFLKKNKLSRDPETKLFLPSEDFSLDKFSEYINDGVPYDALEEHFLMLLDAAKGRGEIAKEYGLYPKQIEQMKEITKDELLDFGFSSDPADKILDQIKKL